MSASLVGSEMCIRDRFNINACRHIVAYRMQLNFEMPTHCGAGCWSTLSLRADTGSGDEQGR
eukprot:2174783-Alexandrium_andersonii.AAC.1